ncbi:MAG: cell division protein FtsQ/DivIB [Segniliparus sp.]|uniref:cell division protein FtsQ/DivIB n=1 Tax=Segniliparus sp. TaxID=2804064 RepID=UPI003F31E9DD
MIRWLRAWGFTAVVILLVVAAGFGVWAGYFSHWFALRSIVVSGNTTITKEEVVRRLDVSAGEPLLRVDLDDQKARVEGIRVVASAQVSRDFPHTLRVEVVERAPIAYVERPGGAHLVDKTGTDFSTVPAPPDGLPKLAVARVVPGDPATTAALAVLSQLPDELRGQVAEVDAKSEIEVSATLGDGRVVVFGSSQDVPHKAQVALALLSQPAQTYNVSSPNTPVLSN